MVSGAPQTFSYNVVVFDPDVVTPGAPVATVTAPATAAATVPFTASVATMANATGYQLDLHRSSALSGALTSANSAASWTQVVSGYNALESTAFHLYHAQFGNQQLILDKDLYLGPGASLSFDSWFGFATPSEVATVRISLDGVSWQDVFSEPGTGSPTASAPRIIDLAPFAGRMIRLRFVFTATGSYHFCTTCGWYFNNIAFNNVSELSLATWATLPPTQPSANLVAPDPGNYVLLARAEYQGTYFGDWGPGSAIQLATADLVAPSVPSGLTAMSNNWNAVHLAWNASSDNVAVTAYQVFRGGVFRTTVNAPAVAFSDTGLAASTLYGYTVAACDAAGNCSAQSSPASATTQAGGSASFTLLLRRGWNLLGNSLELTLNVETVFGSPANSIAGVTSHINSVWKWSTDTGRWQFYAPNETAEQNLAIAKQNQFGVLASIEPGMGYWVKVESSAPLEGVTLAAQSGVPVVYEAANETAGTPAKIAGRSLVTGWQLVAIADALTPSQFNEALSGTAQHSGTVKSSFQTLWAWDTAKGKWYYYDSQLERNGVAAGQGLELVKQYATGNSFLHFEDWSKTLDVGVGFWIRK